MLTDNKALSDLRAAGILPPRITASPNGTISVEEFSAALLRTVQIDPRSAPKGPAAAPQTSAQAVQALRLSPNGKAFANPAAPISREDAVATAMAAAASKEMLRGGAHPSVYPPFDDDASFTTDQSRELAHEAVFDNLVPISPDNKFRPRDPIAYGDAAYLLDAIRLSGQTPEIE